MNLTTLFYCETYLYSVDKQKRNCSGIGIIFPTRGIQVVSYSIKKYS